MDIEKLRARNPHLKIYDVTDKAFAPYGRVLTHMDTAAIRKAAEAIPMPESGSVYHASEPAFEALPIAREIETDIFGGLPCQVGYCYGYNDTLNAAEWHFCSELNIALTPLVLILGLRSDMVGNGIDSAKMKAFYLPAGTVAEVYATSLHFCPCQATGEGFGCVVGLAKGTNLPLDPPAADPLLFKANKWLIAHVENEGLIARGAVPGITGENYKIRF